MTHNYITIFSLILCLSITAVPITTSHCSFQKEIDLTKSTITWTGKKITGSHEGTIALKSGKLTYDKVSWSGGEFIIDMESIICKDLKDKRANNLVSHLKSEDFFDVENHSEAQFTITTVERLRGNHYGVKGDLTIKDITKPIEFMAIKEEHAISATITIDRTAYDIKYGSDSFFDNLGDKAINNEFQLKANLVFK